jgi:hypothetical protein
MKRFLATAVLTLSLGPVAFAQNSTGSITSAPTTPSAATSSTNIPGSAANRDTPGADVYTNKPVTPPQTAAAPNAAPGQRSPDCPAGNNLAGSAGAVGARGTNCSSPENLAQPAPVPGTSNPITGH